MVFAPQPTPDKVDLRDTLTFDCYNQGDLGSCTANAIAAAIQFDQIKQSQTPFTPSRLFIYYNERVIEETVSEDSGAMIRDGIKSVNVLGAPPETDWPYVIARFTRKPTAKAFRKAKAHQALSYARVCQNEDDLCAALASGFPFVYGFSVYESFESREVGKTGVVPMPSDQEQNLGGHAVLAVGYDKPNRVFITRNSWGTDWGQDGYFTIPFDYLTNRDLADDFWQIKLIE